MKKEEFKIIYMGTPEFAVPSLDAIVNAGYNIVAVVTMPDKPQGRGLKLTPSPVKKYAIEKGLDLLQPESLKDETFVKKIQSLNADLGVVVAFRMLPEVIWKSPRYGTINLHGSLLPKYRGAAPINWAIINGEKETGVTTFSLQHAIDTGDILMQRILLIDNNDTAESIHDKMMIMGADVIVDTIDLFLNGVPKGIPQNTYTIKPTPAPKLTKENTEINFSNNSLDIYNFIRGLSPIPSAWCKIRLFDNDILLKVFDSTIIETPQNLIDSPSGTAKIFGKNRIAVKTNDAAIELIMVQAKGKKRMLAKDFINGLHLYDETTI